MSRTTRIVLAALVSLAVIVGIYSSVEGASMSARQNVGAHAVSGSAVDLNHYRAAQSGLMQMQAGQEQGQGHGCDHEAQSAPQD